MKKGAVFSEDLVHRYLLWRKWKKKGYILYVGLNPSVGNANREDVTIHKLIRLTKHNGFGGFFIVNLYTKVGQEWNEIKFTGDLVRKDSYRWIKKTLKEVKGVCFMVGNKGLGTTSARSQFSRIVKIANKSNLPVYVFRLGFGGAPSHPLMMPTDMDYLPVKIDQVSLKVTLLEND